MTSTTVADVDAIGVRVLLFSVLREQVGQSTVELQLEAHSRPRDLLDRLTERFPAVAVYRGVIRVAVNHAYVDEDLELNEGDEVALITPVSGG